jgi:hypothetical protein
MSDSQSEVFLFDGSDPEMLRAHEIARANFRYFWRELPQVITKRSVKKYEKRRFPRDV